jgi:SAM-dependent methyltransferase
MEPKTVTSLIGPPEADGEYVVLRGEDGDDETVHLHDYRRLYGVPGLYEHIVQDLLQCRSPQVAADGLGLALRRLSVDPAGLRLLDLGAGTGLVGGLVGPLGVHHVIGLDALQAAREACLRDRPEIYDDYLVGDLADPDPQLLARLRDYRLNGLVSAGAFGGTHVPPAALENAVALLAAGAPVVFTIDERWMRTDGPGGFRTPWARLLHSGSLVEIERSRFRHRVTTSGEPILYELVVAATGPRD